MASLTQEQVNTLKNKGYTEERIAAIAQSKGFEMPKGSIAKSLLKSEIGFGQSIAGALGNVLPGSITGKKAIDESNEGTRAVTENLISKIKEKRAKGEDTTRLTNALKLIDKEVNFYDILNTSTGGSLDKSAKQVFGEGLGVATDIIGAGALPGGVGQAAKATSFAQGVKTGAKAGVVGGSIFGGAKAGSLAAQDNLSGGEIVGKTVGGAITGGIAGGILGGAIGGVSGAIVGRKSYQAAKEAEFVTDLVSPKQTKDIDINALNQGRTTDKGWFKSAKIIPDQRTLDMADAAKGVVSKSNSTQANINNINTKVNSLNEKITNYVKVNKSPFNENQLINKLNKFKQDSQLIFASDATAEKTYDAVVSEFLKHVKNKDTLGLLQARQSFDKIPAIKKLLESASLGENTRRTIVRDVRTAANEYVMDLLPKNSPYKPIMLRENLLLDARDNISDKAQMTLALNKIQELSKKYPALKWIVGGSAAALVGGGSIGVGGAILGSTN